VKNGDEEGENEMGSNEGGREERENEMGRSYGSLSSFFLSLYSLLDCKIL